MMAKIDVVARLLHQRAQLCLGVVDQGHEAPIGHCALQMSHRLPAFARVEQHLALALSQHNRRGREVGVGVIAQHPAMTHPDILIVS